MVAMSGGVDSSVAALLLRDDGYELCGVTGKMFGSNVLGDQWESHDAWLDAVDDAKRVCRGLGIPHHTLNLKDVFEETVIEDFVESYLSGRTPNPCVRCNRFVKFGALQRRRAELGFDALATGHYARIAFDEPSGRWQLLRARSLDKDQTYFLAGLTQDQLAHTLFPLGDLSKDEVRKRAVEAGLPNSRKPESQDICFVPDGDYRAFVQRWAGDRLPPSGPIETADGSVLGQHTGLVDYTIGQRKGIGIAAAEPLYVIAKDGQRNALIVGPREELMTRTAAGKDVNFVALAPEDAPRHPWRVRAKTTYRQDPRHATAVFDDHGVRVTFDEPVMTPAPGQALVLYDEATAQTVLAGATIV